MPPPLHVPEGATSAIGENVTLYRDGAVAILTLNRPAVRNAINDAARSEIVAHLDLASRDVAVRALVLTGAGKGFCSGGDIAAMLERADAPAGEIASNGWHRQQRTHHAALALFNFDKPTIAAVNGAAVGLGCDIAQCCDFIVAADSAMFAMSYVLRGLVPDGGGVFLLPRRVGLARAKELIYTGRKVPADEALAIGLADRVVSGDGLVPEAVAWARQLSQGSATAIALAKSLLNRSFELSIGDVFALGSQAQAICYTTTEHRASIEAFLGKGEVRS